jgi:hypothetical protein
VLCALLIGAVALLPRLSGGAFGYEWWPAQAPSSPPAAAPPAVLALDPVPSAAAPPAASPTPTAPDLTKVLQLPGRVPSHGDGKMTFATGKGPILGGKGTLRRFRVAVERDSGEDPGEFAEQVEATLGDGRSWAGAAELSLQRVAEDDDSNFTIYLATRDTAQKMCRAGGVSLIVGGVPYTSCRTTGRVVINMDRWRRSARPYTEAGVPLDIYRKYVVNHEVGHELGHHHEGCPRRKGPAPVMVQQTLTLQGCTPYPWPRLDGRRYAGPPRRGS